MLDHKHFSAEQIDFLDKFFKDNPWADNAQIETIVKSTGLPEITIKVIKKNNETNLKIFVSSRHILINVGLNGIRCIHRIII